MIHVYKDRQTGEVMAKADHKLMEVLPGLLELPIENKSEVEEVSMSKDDKREHLDHYIDQLRKLIPSDSLEREKFESSIESVKNFILHENLKFYCNSAALHDSQCTRESMPLVYGYKDAGSKDDALLMIRSGLVEELA